MKDQAEIERDWAENPRWKGVKRGYGADEVVRLRGTVEVEYSLARQGAEKLWRYMHEMPYVNALGA
ncbi:MAG: isocitrate lyase, partial [Halorhodospira sp.]